jgi:hypothetical protein
MSRLIHAALHQLIRDAQSGSEHVRRHSATDGGCNFEYKSLRGGPLELTLTSPASSLTGRPSSSTSICAGGKRMPSRFAAGGEAASGAPDLSVGPDHDLKLLDLTTRLVGIGHRLPGRTHGALIEPERYRGGRYSPTPATRPPPPSVTLAYLRATSGIGHQDGDEFVHPTGADRVLVALR